MLSGEFKVGSQIASVIFGFKSVPRASVIILVLAIGLALQTTAWGEPVGATRHGAQSQLARVGEADRLLAEFERLFKAGRFSDAVPFLERLVKILEATL